MLRTGAFLRDLDIIACQKRMISIFSVIKFSNPAIL
jgi:hypothetical protein